METEQRKWHQGFFSALKEEVVRGLSPVRSRATRPGRSISPMADLLRRCSRKQHQQQQQQQLPPFSHLNLVPDSLVRRSGSLGPISGGEALAPLMEGPPAYTDANDGHHHRRGGRWGNWVKKNTNLSRAPSLPVASAAAPYRRSDLRLLLGVMGAPLAPVHVTSTEPLPHLSVKDTPIETSSAHYILQQYLAATGGQRLLQGGTIANGYAMGKLKMVASEFETPTKLMKNRNPARAAETGGFVLWQMNPDMWYVELSVGGSKVHAGCNGKLVWRRTPWLGVHAAKGPVRPLRRALQGLDPRTTASMFANARCIGEKIMNGEDCFILKLSSDPLTLKARSEGPAEIIRHVLFGYFSQRTGLLVHMEDSHLTRIQSDMGGNAVYWETTISTFMDDYRLVEGVMIAHLGRSVVTLFRFGETAMSHSKTRMEEAWTIDEVSYNVPGLSMDCFIPPADIQCGGSASEACEMAARDREKISSVRKVNQLKYPAAHMDKPQDGINNVVWKVEI